MSNLEVPDSDSLSSGVRIVRDCTVVSEKERGGRRIGMVCPD